MRKPNRRVLPTIIGVSVAATLGVNVTVLLVRGGPAAEPAPVTPARANYVAAAGSFADLSPQAVAPLGKRLEPHVLVAAPATLSPALVQKVRGAKGVAGVEVVDASRAWSRASASGCSA
ncbi:hypothetical protein [Actinomadura sp. CNU-125]|uniref:hypothetical protein n=1 Tax=Actinomadura sp. CNU-125 TaxID=1904961 RepID=UPI0021CD05CF|nr:hypothetical protein [Actinomadura sp. CNU-125]